MQNDKLETIAEEMLDGVSGGHRRGIGAVVGGVVDGVLDLAGHVLGAGLSAVGGILSGLGGLLSGGRHH
jgi:hypothetical protein